MFDKHNISEITSVGLKNVRRAGTLSDKLRLEADGDAAALSTGTWLIPS